MAKHLFTWFNKIEFTHSERLQFFAYPDDRDIIFWVQFELLDRIGSVFSDYF